MGVEHILPPISETLGQGHLATDAGRNLLCPYAILTTFGRYIPPIMLSTWWNFEEIGQKVCFLAIFCVKF